MGGVLRQSTAVTLMMGPFLDENDGRTVETGLTIAQGSIKLSKNGGTKAQKNESSSAAHDSDGDYAVDLDATDTNTVGRLRVSIDVAGAGPVWDVFDVVEEAVYDTYYASGATGLDAAGIRTAVGLASANLDTQLGDIPTNSEFEARTLPMADYFDPAADTVANVTTVATVTNAVTAGTVSDKTGYSLSSAGIQAIWDALTSALSTASSIGKLLVDNINATISSRSSHSAADVDTELSGTHGGGSWETATGFSTLDAAGVRSAVGLASANLDTQIAALPTAGENADAVWTETLADHSGESGSTAEALASAATGGDPWATSLPASYTGSQAGKILADILTDTGTDIPAAIAAIDIGGGSGANSVTITIDDGSDPVESASVRVSKGAETYVLQTDADGEAAFSLDAGTWTVRAVRQGYAQLATQTLVVDGTETVTYSLTALDISPPDSPEQVTGYAYCYDADGAEESGVTVYIKMVKKPANSTGHHYSYQPAELTSDGDGLIEHTGLFPGATYRIWRAGNQQSADQFIIAADAVSPVAIADSL